jgi:NTE family protein
MVATKRVGLVLSGGGALGAAHVGVLEVLDGAGIRPCCVSGASAGSAVGSVYCAGMSVERIKELALTMDWSKIGHMVRPRGGFFDSSRLERYLIELIGDRTFDQLQIPFAAAAADILRDELVILREGRLAPAVRASCAFPGVFTPVQYEGRLLVDGGLINNLPVAAVREMGAEYVIAVDLSAPLVAPRKPPANLLEMWFLSLATLIRNTHREANLADVVIFPAVGEFNWVDLSQIPVLIERGREAAQRVLPRILSDLNMEAEVES